MTTKLKNLQLTSVDLVRAGANQEADICLYKSADDVEPDNGVDKKLLKKLFESLKKAFSDPDSEVEKEDDSETEERTFDEVREGEEENPNRILGTYLMALEESFQSIQSADLTDAKKKDMMKQSFEEFNEAMKELIPELAAYEPEDDHLEKSDDAENHDYEELEEVPAS